jgi:ethanolamine utilization protein EutN
MFLAKVKINVVATIKHSAYVGRKVFVVQPIAPDGGERGGEWVAVDYVGAGIGDTVVCGSSPGAARKLFGIDRIPIRTLILAIVDRIDLQDAKPGAPS